MTAVARPGDRAPKVVAIGGGHGTATALGAVRQYASEVTAVVSVADDGGSSGRLRQLLDVVAYGDLRRCLVALAGPDSLLAQAFEHRFAEGELAGHALGNLVLAGLVEASGDLVAGIDSGARLLDAVGRVLPATSEPVVLKAEVEGLEVAGEAAVARSGGIRRVALVPEGATSPPEVAEAILAADQVVLGPGSLFTSVLAAAVVPAVARALAATRGQRVYVCNLGPESPETDGYDVAAHLDALLDHGVAVDVVLCDTGAGLDLGAVARPVHDTALAGRNPGGHDPGKLARGLTHLLA